MTMAAQRHVQSIAPKGRREGSEATITPHSLCAFPPSLRPYRLRSSLPPSSILSSLPPSASECLRISCCVVRLLFAFACGCAASVHCCAAPSAHSALTLSPHPANPQPFQRSSRARLRSALQQPLASRPVANRGKSRPGTARSTDPSTNAPPYRSEPKPETRNPCCHVLMLVLAHASYALLAHPRSPCLLLAVDCSAASFACGVFSSLCASCASEHFSIEARHPLSQQQRALALCVCAVSARACMLCPAGGGILNPNP
jgi:hypothetical protein